ncbi:MAG: hypothetical protein AUK06_00220 [Parcubacteria group bacterium CG2_30_36_18]|nr:MAG: hypothetical protein AUK06_00220 [Parcubacteria group bacterium CG2_30_36_18]
MNPEIPVEYEKGYTKFLNCKIDLRNRVFIPRIETEFWVKKAFKNCKLQIANCKLKKVKILDIFAGSGCIGIAVLKNIKNSRVDFADIDKRAIEQIKINLKLSRISPKRYKIYQSNLFEKLKGKYNYIFANPPYAAKEKLKEVQPSVLRYEPRRAILGGKKGLFYIRKFLKEAKKFLKPDGTIYFEFDPEQKNEISNILRKENYKNFKFFKDEFKKYRFVKVQI